MELIYKIGETYKHPTGTKAFKLVEVDKWIFRFECGHSCTDNVFMNFINVKTGEPVYNEMVQIKMF